MSAFQPVGPVADQQLLDLLPGCVSVVHHIPGRVRLRLLELPAGVSGQPALSAASVSRVVALVERHPAIRQVRPNLLARSCVVEYDPGQIPARAWDDWLAGSPSPEAAVLLGVLITLCQEVRHAEL